MYYFNTLAITEFENIQGIKFSEEHRKWLEDHYSSTVAHGNNKFCICEYPRLRIYCGDLIRGTLFLILMSYDYSNSSEDYELMGDEYGTSWDSWS